jgi:hypothetical protein
MKRRMYCSVIVVLVAILVASAFSQVQRPQVRVRRSGGQSSGTQSMQSWAGPMDPNMTPQQRMAQNQRDFQQQMAQMQRQVEQMQRQAEESRYNAIRQMLNAADAQWPQIKEKLDLIDRLKTEASVAIDLGSSAGTGGLQGGGMGFSGGGFMGGWAAGGSMGSSGQPQTWSKTWSTPSTRRSSANPTDGEVLCEQLVRDLQTPGTPPADIAQRVAALRKIRSQAREQLAQTRKDLRSLVTAAQEPALVAMGYLD